MGPFHICSVTITNTNHENRRQLSRSMNYFSDTVLHSIAVLCWNFGAREKSPRCSADLTPHLPLQICQSRQKSNEKEKSGKNEESAKNEQIGQNWNAAWLDSHGLDLGNLSNILASYLAFLCVCVCVCATFAHKVFFCWLWCKEI